MPKSKGNEFHICICQTCDDHPKMPWVEFMEHCKNKHGVKENEVGTKEMQMHLDETDFYEWIYICKFGDKVEFIEISRNKRVGDNARIWREK